MRPVDKLLAGYLTIVTLLVLVRGGPTDPGDGSLLVLHTLIGLLLFLFTRLDEAHTVGQFLWDLYPLLLIPFLYAEIGVLAEQLGRPAILAHDAIVQRWEEALFGSQVSYVWIREAPSVFWSTVLHLAYFSYYPIVFLGPFLLLATGPVRQVWSARLVYAILEGGSSIGAAFPSSHVAATIAATLALWHQWRSLALVFLVPAMLLVVATVYCQMHYVIDAVTGLMVGIPVGWLAPRVEA